MTDKTRYIINELVLLRLKQLCEIKDTLIREGAKLGIQCEIETLRDVLNEINNQTN